MICSQNKEAIKTPNQQKTKIQKKPTMDSSSSSSSLSLSSSTRSSSSKSSRRSCQSVPVTPVAGKVVRFHPAVVALQIQPMYDILVDGVEHIISMDDACDMLWYNEIEYNEFANEARTDQEFITKLRQRSAIAADAKTAVLLEQAYLRSTFLSLQSSLELQSSITSITTSEGGSDMSIAEAYIQNCHKAREQALLTGLRDAKWVQDENNNNNNNKKHPHGTHRRHHHRTSRRSSRSSSLNGQPSEYRQQRERYLKAKKSSSAPPRRSDAMKSSSSSSTTTTTTTISAAVVVAAAAYTNTNSNNKNKNVAAAIRW